MISQAQISSNSSSGKGNIKVLPTVKENVSKKQISPARDWFFTFNNYTDEDLIYLRSIVPQYCSQAIIGFEKGESGTPHLQGNIKLKTKGRPLTIFSETKKIWWEKTKFKKNADAYCGKEEDIFLSIGMPDKLIKMTYDLLRPEQRVLVDLFEKKEDPLFGRKVHWFWEPHGCWGKSMVCLHMIDFKNAYVVQGKNNDILCGFKSMVDKGETPPIVIFDIPRCNDGHVSYQAIESLKNGFFYSGKYESDMCRFNKPHVVCYANTPPDLFGLSEDRWVIERLEDNTLN